VGLSGRSIVLRVGAPGNREVAERYFRAFETWTLETVESLLAEDAVDGRPQSGERFVGRANVMGMLHALPSLPAISWTSIRGGPRVWVAEGTVDYGEGPVNFVGIAEVEDDLVSKADFYFADPFEPADWRAPFAEPS
jgi:SnoaL-like domain